MVRRVKDVLSRLRAALTPQAVLLLAAALLLVWLASAGQRTDASALETRLAKTLSHIDGVGQVEVTIRLREVASSGSTFGAAQIESVPCGAVIVAQGAGDPLVELKLSQAVCALLGLPASAVSVMEGGK